MHVGRLGNSRCMYLRSNACLLPADIGWATAGADQYVMHDTYKHATDKALFFVLKFPLGYHVQYLL